MELFNKIKNKLGLLALFGLLFQLAMPVYQTYVFAQEEITAVEAVQAGQSEDGEDDTVGDVTETPDGEVKNEDANVDIGGSNEADLETAEKEVVEEEVVNEEVIKEVEEPEIDDAAEADIEAANIDLLVNRESEKITDNIIDDMKLLYKDGTAFEDGDLIDVDEDLRFELDWSLSNDKDYVAGDYFEFKLPEQLTVYNSLDGPLGDYGTYTVDTTGNVKFTFNEKVEEESDINGTFWFDTELNEEKITTTEETIDLVINNDIVQTITVNVKPTAGQAISKEGQPVDGNFNTEEVEWTVVVNTTRELLKNAIIDDPILAGQELILDSVKLKEVEVDIKGEVTKELEEVTGFTDNSTEEKLNIELGDTNKAYRLTFKTKLLEDDFKEGTTKYENTAYLKSDGKKDAQAGGSVSVSRPKSMEKTSTAFDKGKRSIEWTVNANFTEQNLKKDDVITDEFTFTVGKEELNDVFEIKSENISIKQVDKFDNEGKPKETSDAKDLFDITIEGNKVTYKLKENSNKAFILKYKTELKEGAYINKDGKITNEIELKGKTATGSQGVYQQVGKKTNAGINYEDKTIDWTITINADKQDLRNFVLTDSFAGSGQKLVEGSIEITPEASSATVTPDANQEGFKIDFGNIKETYIIKYQTKFTYDFKGKETPSFKNGVKITYGTSDGSDYELGFGNTVTPNEETKSNGAKNGEVNQETKEITWKIDINYNQLKLINAKVTDEIPNNQTLIDDSVKVYETSIAKNGNITVGTDVTNQFKVDATESHVDVTSNETINKSYRIEFKTKDKDDIYNDDEVYENTAQFIPREGEKHNLTAKVTLPNQGEFIGKTGTHNKEDWTIDWKIDVNKSLSTTSDFTVTDDLGEGQILLEDTIKVTKAGSTEELKEGEGKDYKLTVDGNKFEIYFPGKITEAYVITYSSYILAEETTDITNKAEIQSNDVIKGTTDKTEIINIKISTGGGTGEGVTGGLILGKFEKDSKRKLEGIQFELIKTVGKKEIVVRDGLTDTEGKLEWKGLKYGDYTLKETIPEGYDVDTSDDTITEKDGKAIQKVTITGKDPDRIKILPVMNIRKTGTAKMIKVDTATGAKLTGAEFTIKNQTTGQEYTFTTNDKGEILEVVPFGEYTVKEITAPAGYRITEGIKNITVNIGDTGEDANVTVENAAYIDLKGQKIWHADEDTELPESITVKLFADGKEVAEEVVTSKGDWKYSFEDLDKYDAKNENKEINYTINEVPVDGYITEKTEVAKEDREEDYIHEINLTNIETRAISGTKTWKDNDDATGKRPASITVELIGTIEKEAKDEEEVQKEVVKTYTTTASVETDWKYEFKNLPKYTVNSEKITYELKESVDGYDTTYDDFDITNTRANDLEINGEKIWKDANAGSRPTEIEVELYRQLKGEEEAKVIETKTVKPDGKGKWVYDFGIRPQFNTEGIEYNYSVKEKEVPSGYRSSVQGYDITNLRVGSTSVSGTKRWKDDTTDARPSSITVNLLRNGQIIRSEKIRATDNWSYNFANLSTYDSNGQFYSYRITEDEVPGYKSTISGNDIVNTRSEKIDIKIEKSWLDDNAIDRPTSIDVDVYQNNELYDTVTLTAADEWTYELTNLDGYDEEGQSYTYNIKEETLDGYEASIDGYQITNLRVGTTEVDVLKKWVNDEKENRPKTIDVDLLQNGEVIKTIQLSETTGWKYTFADLEEFDSEGKVYEYTVKEKLVKGYRVSLEKTDAGFEITNRYLRPGEVEDDKKPDDPTEDENGSKPKPNKPGQGGVEGSERPQGPQDGVEGYYTADGVWLPKTGETNNFGLYLIGGLLIFGGLVLNRKRIEE